MKSIQIYRTKSNYKIITMYKLKSGSYILSEPIFILPVDSIGSDLVEKILISLDESREILESEEDKYWLGNNLLKKIKESSFDRFYRTSVSCIVSTKGQIMSIVPQKYISKDLGLDIQEENSLEFSIQKNNKELIIESIRRVLNLIEK